MRVLVAEDESSLAKQLTAALRRAGYAVDHAADGERADLLANDERYDAAVLDLGLPKVDGLTLLRRWREAGQAMPVLVLTARGSWHEKVQGIDGGADDYMTKPFRMEELLARLRALIRRSSGQINPELRCGPLVLDPRSGKVAVEGVEVNLDQPRISRALLPHAPQPSRRLAKRTHRTYLFPRIRSRLEHRRSLHRPSATKARSRLHRDRAQPRLPHEGFQSWP